MVPWLIPSLFWASLQTRSLTGNPPSPRDSGTYPPPALCSGSCQSRDPTVIQRSSDGTYFRIGTGRGLLLSKADSLFGPWTYEGNIFPDGSSFNPPGHTGASIWAPAVYEINGTYYMYYAVSTGGTQNSVIGVATSDSLDLGTWTDHGSTGLLSQPGEGYNAIDPCLILLPDGTYQLVFGSQWQQIYYVDMQTSLLQIGNDIQGPISHGSHLEEGSYLYFYNDYYYLFVSAGNCCGFSESHHPTDGTEYHVTVCRSNSATTGFVDQNGTSCTESGGTTILASHDNVYAPGGQGIYNDPTYGVILYYMFFDPSVGYGNDQTQWGWNPIDWSSGWPTLLAVEPQSGFPFT